MTTPAGVNKTQYLARALGKLPVVTIFGIVKLLSSIFIQLKKQLSTLPAQVRAHRTRVPVAVKTCTDSGVRMSRENVQHAWWWWLRCIILLFYVGVITLRLQQCSPLCCVDECLYVLYVDVFCVIDSCCTIVLGYRKVIWFAGDIH